MEELVIRAKHGDEQAFIEIIISMENDFLRFWGNRKKYIEKTKKIKKVIVK